MIGADTRPICTWCNQRTGRIRLSTHYWPVTLITAAHRRTACSSPPLQKKTPAVPHPPQMASNTLIIREGSSFEISASLLPRCQDLPKDVQVRMHEQGQAVVRRHYHSLTIRAPCPFPSAQYAETGGKIGDGGIEHGKNVAPLDRIQKDSVCHPATGEAGPIRIFSSCVKPGWVVNNTRKGPDKV